MSNGARSASLGVPGVSLPRVMASEWVKLRSLRSSIVVLIASSVLVVGAGVLTAAAVAGSMADRSWDPGGDPFSPHDATAAVLYGVQFAQLLIGLLGVLVASSEYGTGMIRATLAAVPTRLPVLWAKLVVIAAVSFVTMLSASAAAFGIGRVFLNNAGVQLALSDGPSGSPAVLRAVFFGAPLYLCGVAILAITLGFLLRNTAAAIAMFYVVMFFLAPLLGLLLPGDLGHTLASFLPSAAGQAFMAVTPRSGLLTPWVGFAVFCGYLVVMTTAAAVVLKRRDA